jgi:hypothetical protein
MKNNVIGGKCCIYTAEERFIQGLEGNAEAKKPLERPRPRWKHNTKIDPQIMMAGLRLDCCG